MYYVLTYYLLVSSVVSRQSSASELSSNRLKSSREISRYLDG